MYSNKGDGSKYNYVGVLFTSCGDWEVRRGRRGVEIECYWPLFILDR